VTQPDLDADVVRPFGRDLRQQAVDVRRVPPEPGRRADRVRPDRRPSHAWARHRDEAAGDHGAVDGLLDANAHDAESAPAVLFRYIVTRACSLTS
jgi:hypothetical protein